MTYELKAITGINEADLDKEEIILKGVAARTDDSHAWM